MITALLLLAVIGHAVSTPTNGLVLHEQRSNADLRTQTRVDGDSILPIRIALAQSNLGSGYDYVLAVSDPRSAQYGRHWTTEEIHAKFAPSKDTVETVLMWLYNNGYDRDRIASSASTGWLAFEATARDAETLFSTQYYEETIDDGSIGVVCNEYHLPSHLTEHIDYISPGIGASLPFKKTRSKRMYRGRSSGFDPPSIGKVPTVSPFDTSTCGEWMTPFCLKALYDIPNATINQPENALGIYEDGDVYDQEDLNLYWSHFAPWVPNGTHPNLQSINDAEAPVLTRKGGLESTIDFDLAFSLLYPQEVTLYQIHSTPKQREAWAKDFSPQGNKMVAGYFSPFITALDGPLCTQWDKDSGADCGTLELTKVLSVSYGYSELYTPERTARRICSEFMKLALKGNTILVASGDFGVADGPPILSDPFSWPSLTNGCIDPKHIDSLDFNGTVFNPLFSASCPYVTAVGGTQLMPEDSVGSPESAMDVRDPLWVDLRDVFTVSSGGGVSNYFPMPEYQKDAVDEYFSKQGPRYRTYRYEGKQSAAANGGIHAVGGRGFPDVAANGAHMPLFLHGNYSGDPGTGTSLSAPIVASIITLINQQRTIAGKSPVGFINPVIYQYPEAFNDITRGKNSGCGTEGFAATEGWDPITGLGTPNYPKLLEVFMALP